VEDAVDRERRRAYLSDQRGTTKEAIMVSLQTPVCDFGWKAVDFKLPGIDGRTHSLADVRGPKGTLVMFICNHCPYVKAIVDRLVRDVKALQAEGMGAIAIMSNDVANYPEDSFDNMKLFAAANGFTFPYVIDETQEIARAYGAVCTPDFFGFNADLELQYRGRLDASRKEAAPSDARRELHEGMLQVLRTGKGPAEQTPSMGCSIKWKGE
jgi:peroxiredoxin